MMTSVFTYIVSFVHVVPLVDICLSQDPERLKKKRIKTAVLDRFILESTTILYQNTFYCFMPDKMVGEDGCCGRVS